jgi:hypothetical protein
MAIVESERLPERIDLGLRFVSHVGDSGTGSVEFREGGDTALLRRVRDNRGGMSTMTFPTARNPEAEVPA